MRANIKHHFLLEGVVDQNPLVVGIISSQVSHDQSQDHPVDDVPAGALDQLVHDNLDQPGGNQVQQGGENRKAQGQGHLVFIGFHVTQNPNQRFHNFKLFYQGGRWNL